MATTSTVPRFPSFISSTLTSTSTPKPPQLHFKAHNAPSFSQQISQNSLTLSLRSEVKTENNPFEGRLVNEFLFLSLIILLNSLLTEG